MDPDERPVVGVWRWAPPRPVVPKDVILLRRTLAVAFALNVLLLASVVGGVNRNPLTGGDIEGEWEESEEHVDPGLYRDLTYDTEAYAIGRANEQLSAMDVGSVQELDVRKCIAALYCDHSMNNMLKWKIYDLKTWVWFDARTGEIIYYQTTREELHWPDSYTLTYYPEGCIDWPDTDARRQDTTTLALTIAGQFARIPDELVVPQKVTESWCTVPVRDEPSNTTKGVAVHFWTVLLQRAHGGVPTEDDITVRFDAEGRLESYVKEWTMDLAGVPTVPRLNATQAFAALTRYWFGEVLGMAAFPNSTAELAIIEDWGEMGDPFEELERSWEAPTPVLTWHITLYTHHDIPDQAWLDANTGRMVRDAMLD